MKVSELEKKLAQGECAPVYLVLGAEEYSINQAKEAFLKLVPKEEREFNVGAYDMETTPLVEALNDALEIPFFGDKRLVFVKRPLFLTAESKKSKVEYDIDGLMNYLDNPEPTTVLVFLAPYVKLDERKKVTKKLKKAAVLVDAAPASEGEIRQRLKEELQARGYTITAEALEELLVRTDANLTRIMAELPKLTLLAMETREITVAQVERMVTRSLEQNVFKLVDLVLAKKVQAALGLYHDLLEQKEEPLKLNAILLGQFRLLIQIQVLAAKGYAQGNIAQVLKAHPYRVKIALRNIRQYRFVLKDLASAYLGLVAVEKKLKSTQQEAELLFQLFMLEYVK